MRTAAAAALAAVAVASVTSGAKALPTCSAYGMSNRMAAQDVTIQAMLVRSLIVSDATGCDYERLEKLGREHGTFRFGARGSAATYWRKEEGLGHKPLASLLRILRLPYTMVGGSYVWPAAVKGHPSAATWSALVRAGVLTRAEAAIERTHGNVYRGWRAAITPDGDWVSFTPNR